MDMIAFLKSKSPRAVGYPGFRPKAADFSWINRREGKPKSGDMLPRMAMKAVAGETMALPGAKTKWWAWALVVFGFADSLVQDLSRGPAGHEWQMRWLLVIVRMLMLTVFGWRRCPNIPYKGGKSVRSLSSGVEIGRSRRVEVPGG